MGNTIGFIGLGHLGGALAGNLLKKGHKIYIYNRTPEKMEPFIEKGALPCSSVLEVAKTCNIIITCLSDDAALRSITEGDEGLAINLREGGIHISMSTILPQTSTVLETLHQQYKSYYMACPVIGRPEAVTAEKANFCIAGHEGSKATVKKILQDAGGANVFDYGNEAAVANVAKLCTNFLIASAIESMAEALTLAEKSKVDKRKLLSMLTQTVFNSPIYVNYGNQIVEERYQPAGFSLKLGLKDMSLVLAQAEAADINMPFAKLLQERMLNCVTNNLGDYDWTALAMDITSPVDKLTPAATPA